MAPHQYKAAAVKAGLHFDKFGFHGVLRLLELERGPIPRAQANDGRGGKSPAVQIPACIFHGFCESTQAGYAITDKGRAYLARLKAAKLDRLAIKLAEKSA